MDDMELVKFWIALGFFGIITYWIWVPLLYVTISIFAMYGLFSPFIMLDEIASGKMSKRQLVEIFGVSAGSFGWFWLTTLFL